ncbi:MAG TPA: hypothetical protein DCE41_32505 [Cytophagales bacterium]|nr:hypothetical protein [Cytophagales bacterium]HAA17960.1 hypothetical protein [Cytophagales bacterium]HAP64834.1 hypothetical protein [Cytophagales bacterium]
MVALGCALTVTSLAANATTSSAVYRIDDALVEAAFDQSTLQNATPLAFTAGVNQQLQAFGFAQAAIEDPDPVVATLLAFFVGAYGLHRVYLGSGVKMVVLYVLTCGGISGIIPLIDTVMLLIGYSQDDISQYIGNDRFIMWTGQ